MSFSMLLSTIHSPKRRYRIRICLLWFSLLSASETTSCHDRKCNLHLPWASSWACVPAAGYQGLTMVVRLSGQRLPLGSHHLWVPNPSCHQLLWIDSVPQPEPGSVLQGPGMLYNCPIQHISSSLPTATRLDQGPLFSKATASFSLFLYWLRRCVLSYLEESPTPYLHNYWASPNIIFQTHKFLLIFL